MRRIFSMPGRRLLGSALLCAIGLTFLLPSLASAHALVSLSLMAQDASSGTLDGPALFNLVATTLVELGAIFWAAGQLWVNFVLQPSAEKHQKERELISRVEARFERLFSLPTLVLLLITNLGVLYVRALTLASGHWDAALNWSLLSTQATSGNFGPYWLMRMIVILLALIVGLYMVLSKQRSSAVHHTLSLLNLFLAALLFIALTMSGDATQVSAILLPYSVIIDWLHLMAAALWIGSMIYILLVYLPVLKPRQFDERIRSLLTILPQYSTLAIAGVVLMAITGPLSAGFHLTSLDQFASTAYGRTLAVKILLVCVLILTSAYHVYWLRPRLKKEYQKYTYQKERLARTQSEAGDESAGAEAEGDEEQQKRKKQLVQQVKLRERRLIKKNTVMTRILSWEPWIGAAIIVCVGLLNVFAGTLTAGATQTGQQPGASATPVAGAFHGTAKTSDDRFSVSLSINPNRFGTNTFSVQVTDLSTGQPPNPNEVSVTLFMTMLDMDMGTQNVNLAPDSKGGFSGSADLSMGGNWNIQIQIRAPDKLLHEANFKVYTPY